MTRRPLHQQPVHMVGRAGVKLRLFGDDVTTLCGEVGCPTEITDNGYHLTSMGGNQLNATTTVARVTCQKCNNLMTIGKMQIKGAEHV